VTEATFGTGHTFGSALCVVLISRVPCFILLASARAEIRVLQEKVKDLTGRVKVLTVENESLKVEVEIYREEAAAASGSKPLTSQSALGDPNTDASDDNLVSDLFVRSGQGVYPSKNEITWKNVHGSSNNLAVALSPDETVVASGGADKALRLVFSAMEDTSGTSATLDLGAPVISVAFASNPLKSILACGCMDGSAYLVQYAIENEGGRSVLKIIMHLSLPNKHNKYVKTVSWSPNESLLATSSADGTVHMYRIYQDGLDSSTLAPKYGVQLVESLHLLTSIEALTFTNDNQLLCYARNTPYIAAFDLGQDMKQTKINVNKAALNATAGGFDEHVSMAVMDLKVSGATSHSCWLAATDTARNFVLDARSNKIVRNLYGHANDGYSQPKAVWSSNGQYVLGNTQDESVMCVWDVASQQLVDRLPGHGAPIRDLDSSPTSYMVVTAAFDKTTRLWYSST